MASALQVHINRASVISSNIAEAGYDDETRTLEIQFCNKAGEKTGVYRYLNVPPETWNGFLNADSKGRYFRDYIRNQYECHKIS